MSRRDEGNKKFTHFTYEFFNLALNEIKNENEE